YVRPRRPPRLMAITMKRTSSTRKNEEPNPPEDCPPRAGAGEAVYSPRVAAGLQAARVVVVAEGGCDALVDDAMGGRVRERAFQAVSRLDPHLAVLDEHEEDGPVAELAAADAPGLGGAHGEVLQRRRRELGEDRHHDLARGLAVEGLE